MQTRPPSPNSNVEISKDSDIKTKLATSAPLTNPIGSKPNLIENVRRSNTSTSSDPKIRCAISSERLTQLRKAVDDAVREHKTFTIKGGWQTLRNQFLLRGWLEKHESSSANPKQKPPPKESFQSMEDVCTNLPVKQDWESQSAYVLKCEKTIMSRMLQNHNVDFYWNMRREPTDWHHRVNTHQIMNRFARSLFTSKEGLNLLLQQLHWYCQPGISAVNFPRCYTLGFPEHYNNFVEDFRLSACICLLKWLVYKYEHEDEYAIKSPEGQVPYTAIQFALDRCNDYIASQKHLDIDRELVKVWNHEWDQFLSNYYQIVHENGLFLDSNEWAIPLLNAAARTTLNDVVKFWPMMNLDGMKNIWILKPGNKCRGRGIQLIKHMEDVAKVMNLKLKYVVQKYIEKPLLIYETKFDIRQWFMVTSVQPLNIWMYRECYLRFSTQIFSLENFHESLHLTNHAVQCKYANVQQRNTALPETNMWDCNTFKNYLDQIGHSNKWDDVVYPGMRENIVGAMLACQDTMDRRPNTFELYGADFVIAEDFKPWLLEINSSPDLSPSTDVTSRMCPHVLQDIVKVMVDRRRNPNSDTGLFDLVYKQSMPRPPAYLGMSLSVRGRRIFKTKKPKLKEQKDKENSETQQNQRLNHQPSNASSLPSDVITKCIPKILSADLYKGPVIGDLIEELQQTFYPKGHGYEFIPAVPPAKQPKKKDSALKNERVSKRECRSPKSKINKCHFVNRKRNVNENSKLMDIGYRKPINVFIKSANFGSFHEWTLKNKFSINPEQLVNKNDTIWGKDNTNILNTKSLLTKLNIKNFNGSSLGKNKKSKRTPRCCMSSINLSLSIPQLHRIEPQLNVDFSNNNDDNINNNNNIPNTKISLEKAKSKSPINIPTSKTNET